MIQIRDLRILEVENEAGDLPKILMYPNFDPVYMRFSVQKLIVIFNNLPRTFGGQKTRN